jgi:hypothetical protein
MGASLKSDSLLMYLDDKEKEQFKSDLGKVEEGAGEDTEEVGELRDVEPAAVVVAHAAAHVEVERPIRDVVRASPPQPSWGFSYDSDEEDEVVVVEGGGATAKREALLDDFVVQSVSDEQKQMMEDAQKKKSWGQVPEDAAGRAEAADAPRQKMVGESGVDGEAGEDGVDGVNGEDGEDESDDDGLMPAPSPQHLPRTNSEVAVLKKLEELEQKLGVGDGEGGEEEEEEEEEYEDDVEEDEGDVVVVEEKKELTFVRSSLTANLTKPRQHQALTLLAPRPRSGCQTLPRQTQSWCSSRRRRKRLVVRWRQSRWRRWTTRRRWRRATPATRTKSAHPQQPGRRKRGAALWRSGSQRSSARSPPARARRGAGCRRGRRRASERPSTGTSRRASSTLSQGEKSQRNWLTAS